MATRSAIGYWDNEVIRAIYCHWDGYPENNGRILQESYQDPDKIRALVDLGDLSSLGKEIGTRCDFRNPPKGQCVAYSRDRGEDGCDPRRYATYAEFVNQFNIGGVEYWYLWDGKQWLMHSCYSHTWDPLEEVLAELQS